jgi:hypothetical protein
MSAFRVEDNVRVWQETVADAGAVEVPALAPVHGPVWILVEMGDGVVLEHHP